MSVISTHMANSDRLQWTFWTNSHIEDEEQPYCCGFGLNGDSIDDQTEQGAGGPMLLPYLTKAHGRIRGMSGTP